MASVAGAPDLEARRARLATTSEWLWGAAYEWGWVEVTAGCDRQRFAMEWAQPFAPSRDLLARDARMMSTARMFVNGFFRTASVTGPHSI